MGEFNCRLGHCVIGLAYRRGNAVAILSEEELTMQRVPVYSQAFSGVAAHESSECGVSRWNACHGMFWGVIGAVVIDGGHGSVPRGAPWFPRSGTDGADRDRIGNRSVPPVGCDVCGVEPRIT